ncbi:MAG: ribose 5-phosphate isomerase B [Firmicutes bacterium]|nr:ribose 5-phosphate isomerase B [Bacillota bacterium]MCL1953178.1 ribose 5-phosphate isomerase B [Bacillota bacterium]
MKNKQLKIAIACDHAAYQLKIDIVQYLASRQIDVLDFGTNNCTVSVDYPDFACMVAQSITSRESDFGILLCGTGIGMTIAANKHNGIRCALCSDTYSAKLTRLHNNANVLSMGARVIGSGLALDIVDSFLSTEFSNEDRHNKRIAKLEN